MNPYFASLLAIASSLIEPSYAPIGGRDHVQVYLHQAAALPVIKDRDFTLRVTWSDGEARGLRFSIDRTRGPAPTKKAVRMTLLDGRWELEPLAGGSTTRAVYHVQIDLAGAVPRGMVRGGAAKDLPSVYVAMRRLLGERRAR